MPAELSRRQLAILDAAVREYVATGEPVASADLALRYGLSWSPATVRGELSALEEAGYLAQPHTSAGRVPTDRGYRLFINRMAPPPPLASREERQLRELREIGEPAEFVRRTSRILASLTREFVVAGFPEDELFYKAGIRDAVEDPEFADTGVLGEFGLLLDRIEDELATAFDLGGFAEPRVFIGAENPIRSARRYGMIVTACETPFEKAEVIALLGPKRMDYGHHLALLRSFRDIVNA